MNMMNCLAQSPRPPADLSGAAAASVPTQNQQQQQPSNDDSRRRLICGSIVVVAKVPTPGLSKTRLTPLLGEQGSTVLATALLADVLSTLSDASFAAAPAAAANDATNTSSNNAAVVVVDRILLYAPPTRTGKLKMTELLNDHNIPLQEVGSDAVWKANAWTLLPLTTSSSNSLNSKTTTEQEQLKSSNLGALLEHGLQQARQRQRTAGPVIFLGMDSPQVPLDEIAHALGHASQARLCPAADGGYGLLSVPHPQHYLKNASKNKNKKQHSNHNLLDDAYDDEDDQDTAFATTSSVFAGVRWSDPLTAISQMKALTDQNIPVTVGRLMYDIDEPADVTALAQRLHLQQQVQQQIANGQDNRAGTVLSSSTLHAMEDTGPAMPDGLDVLTRSSDHTPVVEFSCPFTQAALDRLGLWPKNNDASELSSRASSSGYFRSSSSMSSPSPPRNRSGGSTRFLGESPRSSSKSGSNNSHYHKSSKSSRSSKKKVQVVMEHQGGDRNNTASIGFVMDDDNNTTSP